MSSFEIVEIPIGDRRLVERFIRVPWHIHREVCPSKHWVPPLLMDRRDYLSPKKNPFFDHAQCSLWIITQDGKDVGRIAAVHDIDYERFHGERVGYFGMFECPNDMQMAQALIERVTEWLKPRGITRMIGPMDLSSNYMMGVLLDAFDADPSMNMPYNPPYYDELLQSVGFSKVKDIFQWELDLAKGIPSRIKRIAELIRRREGVSLRKMSFKNWTEEVERTLAIYNDAWEDNWGFVPVGSKEFQHIAKDLKMVMTESMGLIAEIDGEPVAFALAVFNINPILKKVDGKLFPFGVFRLVWDLKVAKTVKSGRLVVLGIREKYRKRGLDSLLFVEMFKGGIELGLTKGEIGWTLEDNDLINRAIVSMDGTKSATYRVYERSMDA